MLPGLNRRLSNLDFDELVTPKLQRDLAEIETPTSPSSQLTLLEVSLLGGKGKGENSPYSFMVCEKSVFSKVDPPPF